MKKLLILYSLFCVYSMFSQDGILDTSFGIEGYIQTDITGDHDMISSAIVQDDGKILIGGNSGLSSGNFYTLARYLPNGALDSSFGSDGIFLGDGIIDYERFFDFEFIDNNDFLVLGPTSTYTTFSLTKFFEDGTVDLSFGTGGSTYIEVPEGTIKKMMVVENGKILLVGTSYINDALYIEMRRFLEDGAVDVTYGDNGYKRTLVAANEDELVNIEFFEGHFYLFMKMASPTNSFARIAKVDLEGNLDMSFGVSGAIVQYFVPGPLRILGHVTEDGILLARTSNLCLSGQQRTLHRFLFDGTVDQGFGNKGSIPIEGVHFFPNKIMVQPNGRYLLSGNTSECFETHFYTVKRYFSNGAIDTSFANDGTYYTDVFDGKDTVLLNDGSLLGVGWSHWFNNDIDFVLTKLLNNPLGVADQEKGAISVYPNPATGIFTVSSQTNHFEYAVFDSSGRLISEGNLSEKSSKIDLTSVQNGIYFLKIENRVIKLVKQ
ncbi:T9SS type A sorting domain-containing protein [Altibacter sp. HG106]|uniref:T9SS type A sorting domain-containing protein n=1 Tax=Altibacter sp. HG106 TaxID=3023937 RepID=UPI002350B13A|nr:T9SS type A sorting domain-containing protein [Altibacter sp. HG106]MDC7994927.1 T9SS type A sorting domain-containing protein [Altibacter sp. HG106]